MVNLLILVDVLKFIRLNQPSPKDVPSTTWDKTVPCSLKRVNHTIIGVRRAINFETQKWIGFQIVLSEALESRNINLSLHF
jgi:hypothetical protein